MVFGSKSYSQTILPFGLGISDTSAISLGPVRCVFVDTITNELYAGGGFEYAGNKKCNGIARWDGTDWFPLGTGILDTIPNSSLGNLTDIIRYKNDIYIAGFMTIAGGKEATGIARWDGNNWHSVGRFKSTGANLQGVVFSMEVFNNELYVVGGFDTINNIISDGVAKWDGQNWTDLSQGIPTDCYGDGIVALLHFNNELYIGGNFNFFGGGEKLLKRVGNTWIQVGSTITGDGILERLKIYQNKLYVSGYFSSLSGNADNNMIYLDNNVFQSTAGGVLPSNCEDMFEHQGELYVSGAINIAGYQPIVGIAKWNGSQWLNAHITSVEETFSPNGTISRMAEYNGNLVVSGSFSNINGVSVNNIAMIDFSTVGFQLNQQNKNLKVFPNPASEVFNIQLDKSEQKGKVCLYNQIGQQVYLQSYGSLQSIAVTNFAKGIYVVEVETEKGVMRQKVVIE